MGSLALPARGPVYIDTQSVIYTVENRSVYAPLLRPLWAAGAVGLFDIVSSEMTLLEVLVGPYKSGDVVLEQKFERLFASGQVRLVPINRDLLRSAARLRAAVPKLRTPDAIHAATALAAGVSLFVSNDAAFRSVHGLPVVILNDVIAAP